MGEIITRFTRAAIVIVGTLIACGLTIIGCMIIANLRGY
jgi:hypothetical protein